MVVLGACGFLIQSWDPPHVPEFGKRTQSTNAIRMDCDFDDNEEYDPCIDMDIDDECEDFVSGEVKDLTATMTLGNLDREDLVNKMDSGFRPT